MMVALLDYLTEFLFVLPGRINVLHDSLAAVAVDHSSSVNNDDD